MITHVAFDFDGTLVDSSKVFISCFNQLAEKHGFTKIDLNNLAELKELSMTERMKRLRVPVWKLPFLVRSFRKLYSKELGDIPFVDGIIKMFEEIKAAGFKIAIISSNAEKSIRLLLEHNEIYGVEDVYCYSKLFSKESALKKYVSKKKIRADELVYVCDEARDVAACKKAGVRPIWVSWGFETEQAIGDVQYVAHAPEAIKSLITRLRQTHS